MHPPPPRATRVTLCSRLSYSQSSPKFNTMAIAITGREHNCCWKTGSKLLGQPMTHLTAGSTTYTLSHGSLWPSKSRTMVPRIVAHDCAHASLDRAQNAP